MTIRDYASQADTSTYRDHALDDRGGRFANAKDFSVTGTAPLPPIPAQPAGSWTNDPVPPEPLIDGTDCGTRWVGPSLSDGAPEELGSAPSVTKSDVALQQKGEDDD